MRKRSFTTTLPTDILQQLDEAARDTGRNKNDIIVEAVHNYVLHIRQHTRPDDAS